MTDGQVSVRNMCSQDFPVGLSTRSPCLIFAVRHDCIHITLIEHPSMKYIQTNKNKNRPTKRKEAKYKAQRKTYIPVAEFQLCI